MVQVSIAKELKVFLGLDDSTKIGYLPHVRLQPHACWDTMHPVTSTSWAWPCLQLVAVYSQALCPIFECVFFCCLIHINCGIILFLLHTLCRSITCTLHDCAKPCHLVQHDLHTCTTLQGQVKRYSDSSPAYRWGMWLAIASGLEALCDLMQADAKANDKRAKDRYLV